MKGMKTKLLTLLGFLILFLNFAQAQHEITFEIDNYNNDTLVIGNYIMDKQLVYDTLYAKEEGVFVLKDSIPVGVYLALTYPDKQYIQFLVNDFEKEFKVIYDYESRENVSFEGSLDNAAFQGHVNFLKDQRPLADSLRAEIDTLSKQGVDTQVLQEELDGLSDIVLHRQDSLIATNPGFLSTLLLKSNLEVPLLEADETEESKLRQYYNYKYHYFDNIDLGSPYSLRTPFLFHRVSYYIDKLTPVDPDSIISAIDSVLTWMEPAPETYMYYLSHYLNSYAQPKIVGMDKVYVHLAENYYGAGKATWAKEENIEKILDRAIRIKPTLIGKIGADIQVFQEDGTPISISEIDYEFLVLLFWAPDCGHCKKSMPSYVEFNEEFKHKGVKTFAICTKYRDKVKDCWESVEEKNMHGFINGADEFNRSDFKLKYNVDSTPKVFILDKNREIIMKNIGGNQLKRAFEEIIFPKYREQESPKPSDQ